MWKNSSNGTDDVWYGDWYLGVAQILPAVSIAVISVVGIIGNSLVICIVGRNRKMWTVTNLYISSLAMTDIMFLICCGVTTTTITLTADWLFGDFMCRFVAYMQLVTVQATCGTLTALTVDRYKVITMPLRSMAIRTTKKTMILIAIIWLGSLLLHIPIPIYTGVETDGDQHFCIRVFPNANADTVYLIYSLISTYLLPLAIVAVCSGLILRALWCQQEHSQLHKNKDEERVRRQKWRVTKMVFTVAGVFAICWAPIQMLNLWWLLDDNFPETAATHYFRYFCLCLSYSNSTMNPFVYALSGRKYRRYLRRLFRKKRQAKFSRGSITTTTTCNTTLTTSIKFHGENGRGDKPCIL
ncbi:kisspeptin receptor 2 [Saccoglossus kowalevskii]|uniref:Kisspeptin receptor 2 n=1 Tax=Saccoglossus kowalevskii TaxID=10224 RepID=D1LX51_SACKO|nr:kisspeptin receptor 2 [Saccoglossus kowalevskii]ACY92557.1 kisspeptin receptor 2 [Saccoglossus kowalevskii]